MAGPLYFDRVQESSTTTGTGTYTLGGATTGYQAWSVVGNTNTAYYMATDGISWEVGLGTWATGGTLARTTILASSNSNAAVSWSAGTRTISLVAPALVFSGFPLAAIVLALSGLANASGYLNNNGSGTLSWGTPAAGQPIPSSSSGYNVGTLLLAINASAGIINDGSTAAGSALKTAGNASNTTLTGFAALTGTWKNITGGQLGTGGIGMWVRTV